IEAVLQPFGLRLAREKSCVESRGGGARGRKARVALSPRAALLLDFLQGDEGTTRTSGYSRRRTTVDYSKYFTDLSATGSGWWWHKPCQLIHLCNLPDELQGRDVNRGQDDMADEWAAGAAEEVAAEDGGDDAKIDGTEASHPSAGQTAIEQVNDSHDHNSNGMNIDSENTYEENSSAYETPYHTTDGNHVGDGDHGINEGEVHTENQQRDDYYISTLVGSLISMLLHYNSGHITTVRFEVAKVKTYLTLAGRMQSLKTISLPDIRISISVDMARRYFSVLAQFIRLNQSTFPRKAPLNLDPGGSYHYGSRYDDYDDPSMLLKKDQIIDDALEFQQLLQGFRAAKERRRLHILENTYTRQYLEVYRAIGRPRNMIIEDVPMAYEQLLKGSVDVHGGEDWEQGQERDADGAIGLDRLVEFRDGLEDRVDYGEGPYMEQFLRRCLRLQKLSIAAGHPELFLWAAEEALQRCVPSSPSPSSSLSCHPARHGAVLPCLQDLKLWSSGFYRFSLQALNDAMTAFAPSLQSVTLKVSFGDYICVGRGYELPGHRVHALRSLQLQSVASANTVGDWPFLLPRLTYLSLNIDVGVSTCIETGTFALAPNLETLSFIISVELTRAERQQRQRRQQNVGQVWQRGQRHGADDEDEHGDCDDVDELEGEEEQEDYTSPHWHGGNVLLDAEQEEIKVNKMALFPLWTLPRLKELYLRGMPAMRFDFRSLQNMKQLEKLDMSMDEETLCALPVSKYMDLQLKTWECHWQEQEEGQGQFTGDEHGQKESVGRRDQLLQMWALPELKDLTLEGAVATMFWLDWLTGISRLSSKDVQGDRNDKDDDEAPLLNSQLSRLQLMGTWRMAPQDVTRLLTVYAPFLQQLQVEWIHLGGDAYRRGYQFLKAITDADHINQTYADRWHLAQQGQEVERGQGQQEQRMPGSALITVALHQLAISEQDKKLLKLSTLTRDQANAEKNQRKRESVFDDEPVLGT
ncbi:hypothetical protein EDD11_009446, partial [Mortierella claussenii]